ncbi:lipoprotein LpqV [Mycolicibacterium hippocampi]|uniref:LpqV protein n=1 Tax=Mycolicibacterium hippocampi TaxID=659824 RepID=A0A7I9ZVP0_9MYCO|nr:lipoprotein LpqV [Mycolicibacterium hippocampi]GFH04816.1 LpqV protein [Mycolicibacterium hippocampi]
MHRFPLRAVGAAVAGLALLSGCSSDTEPAETASPATSPSSASAASSTAAPVAPGEVGVSPGGVTTAVGAPAESTEDDYFQACLAARTWMAQQGGDPKTQIEPFLETLQTENSSGPATFGRPWSELSPGRQSAVIVAVEAAADALCG